MRIGVISDTHLNGFSESLKRVVDAHFRDVDLVLHAGDMVEVGVLGIFSGKEVRAVAGNMDGSSVRSVMPEKLEFELGGYRFGLIHGWGSPFDLRQKVRGAFGRIDCIIYGHSHEPYNASSDGVLFFNPGSAASFSPQKTIGILEINNGISGRIIEVQDE